MLALTNLTSRKITDTDCKIHKNVSHVFTVHLFTLRNLAALINFDSFDSIQTRIPTAAPAIYSKNVHDQMEKDGIVGRETDLVSNRFPREIPDPGSLTPC